MTVVQSDDEGNIDYVTARVRSRRSTLFSDDDYGKLVRMGTGEIARFMEESTYEAEMNRLGSRYAGVDLIEYALNENLATQFEDLLRWADGRLYHAIARYLRKFDAWNVKTVLRGVYTDAGSESIQSDLIPAGEFEEAFLDRLAEASTVREVVDQLEGTVFHDPLEEAMDDFEETDLLVPLENAVDRTFYETLVENLPEASERATELYVEFMRAEIDFQNLRNALRIARSGADMDPAEYFIDGGRLFDSGELRQLTQNTDQLAEHVRASVYGDDLEEALETLSDADSLIEFERAIELALLEYTHTLSNRYPLSICPVLAYVLAKEREVENIRAIARGREAGLDAEAIERELVIR